MVEKKKTPIKNMFDASVFKENVLSSQQNDVDVQNEEPSTEMIVPIVVPSVISKDKKSGSYKDVFLNTFEKDDKNNIAPVNIYASIQAKINAIKLLHPKKSKIDIVNSILKNFFDENTVELNQEMKKYHANLKNTF